MITTAMITMIINNRFTRSIFWELRDLIPFGNHPVYRYLLGWLGAPKVSFLKLTMTPQIRKEVVYKHVVQDIIIPVDEMVKKIKFNSSKRVKCAFMHMQTDLNSV
jgi:hypothetical protein